ncbi:MAG: hypothetical protein CMG07_01025 [Candidatus Marinimicrobia bacterium]|nr:hypothetical protein [Candidatus Neomarinimicrobiota bacterium]|tara:strand:- start:1139 stop:2173 length:1035 start_codon:yes stop_codon:yes gene_type:complete
MKVELFNKKNKKDLVSQLRSESFDRITISFYKYINIDNIEILRDYLYFKWTKLKVLGRVYIANEGINAQLSLPKHNLDPFLKQLKQNEDFNDLKIKKALIEGESFYKLNIKIKNEIVAYKIPKNEYDMNIVGKHFDYKDFNDAIDDGATVIDIRNYYEGEVGRFQNAIVPDIDRSEDLLPEIKKLLKGKESKQILMYCTGGIRCEKASSYLIKNGFKNVNQLDGGIIKYANDIKKNKVKSKFLGKNFVFDNRLGENITNDIISNCHQCNKLSNSHKNCNNSSCHILFIQCDNCEIKYRGSCSEKCMNFNKLDEQDQKKFLKNKEVIFNGTNSDRLRPKINNIFK